MNVPGPIYPALPGIWQSTVKPMPTDGVRGLPPEYTEPSHDLVDRPVGSDPQPGDQPLPPPKRAKDQGIETLRGLAIILMVMGHVISSRPEGGLQVSDDSWYRYFYLTLSPMRMPLFTVISGFVYAMRPVVRERAETFLLGKARRLLFPMASVATVQFLFSAYGPGVTNPLPLRDIWTIYLFPFDQFWFLQSIALVFLCVFAMELTGMLRSAWGWLGCMVVASTIYLAGPTDVTFFSIDGWCMLMVFFLLGVGLNRFDVLSRGRWTFVAAAGLLVVSVCLHQLTLFGRIDPGRWLPWIVLGCGLGATFLLVRLRTTYQPLARLGGYAFTIYLLHCFGVVAGRLLCKKLLGIDQTGVLFVVCLAFGLFWPIVGHLVLQRHWLTRRVFLGLR